MQAGLIGCHERLGTVEVGAGQRLDDAIGMQSTEAAGVTLTPAACRLAQAGLILVPREGGSLELAGIFGSYSSLALRSATPRVSTSVCAACVSTNAIPAYPPVDPFRHRRFFG